MLRSDIRSGDVVYVSTLNSVYTLHARENGTFAVSGGWFDKRGVSPFITGINGCTLGGSMINITTIAACGLCIEFGNRVQTSSIRRITVVRYFRQN